MKSINYRQSEAGRFLWQGLENGNEDIAQKMEEAEQSAEKDKACSEFSSELGDLAELCSNGVESPDPESAPTGLIKYPLDSRNYDLRTVTDDSGDGGDGAFDDRSHYGSAGSSEYDNGRGD